MTGPTGTAPPLEGNTFLINNERNRVLHPYPLCELLLYLFCFDWYFLSMRERSTRCCKHFRTSHESLANSCFSFRQHGHKNGIPSDRRAERAYLFECPAIDWLCFSPCFQISCEPHVPILPILIGHFRLYANKRGLSRGLWDPPYSTLSIADIGSERKESILSRKRPYNIIRFHSSLVWTKLIRMPIYTKS